MEHDQAHDNPIDSFVPSSSTMTGNPASLVDIRLIPFIPSREQAVANLDTIFLDLENKRIVRRTEKRMKMGDQPVAVMVTKKTVMHRTNEDP